MSQYVATKSLEGNEEAVKACLIAVLDRIGGGISFVDFEYALEAEGFAYKGESALCLSGNLENIVMWTGWSKLMIDLFISTVHPITTTCSTSPLVYMIDGRTPRMPLAKKARAYKEPHWAPVCFSKKGLKK